MIEGFVLSSRSGRFRLELSCGSIVEASARKKAMSASGRSNPIVAGDRVELSSPHAGEYVIERLIPRKTLISRGSDKRRGRTHTIIANADHALVVFAADKPRSRVPGIDRYIVACEYQHLDVTLVFNKWDLADDESRALAELYERAGYTVLRTCAISEPELTRQQVMNVDFHDIYITARPRTL